MSLLIGLTNERYLTPVKTPYPGFRVAIPDPKIVGKYVSKNFVGLARTQTEYFEAAVQWRDKKYEELHNADHSERIFHKKQTNSSIGIPGVTYVEKKVNKKFKNGTTKIYVVPCILAQIATISGVDYRKASGIKSKLFSIRKYGKAIAISMAQDWRCQMEEQLKSGVFNQVESTA